MVCRVGDVAEKGSFRSIRSGGKVRTEKEGGGQHWRVNSRRAMVKGKGQSGRNNRLREGKKDQKGGGGIGGHSLMGLIWTMWRPRGGGHRDWMA